MDRVVLFWSHVAIVVLVGVLLSATSWAEDKLVSPSQLEMFVDELPDMPKIQGYDVVDGVTKPKLLKIGMFQKKWVCLIVYFHLFFRAINYFLYAAYVYEQRCHVLKIITTII